MTAHFAWKYGRNSLRCKCLAGICDYYDKKLCMMGCIDTVQHDNSCIAFPERWGMMFSREEELKIDQELGFGR
jgi:hypothetical protein